MFDMHFHSTLSDGKNSPEEIIQEAQNKSLKFISFTDHDIISNPEQIKNYGFESCYSSEISAKDKKNNLSLHLTYYSSVFNQKLNLVLENTIERKKELIKLQIVILQNLGLDISYQDIIKYSIQNNRKIEALNKYDIAVILFSKNGNIEKIKEISGEEPKSINFFWIDYLKKGGKFFDIFGVKEGIIQDYEPSIEDCSEIIKKDNSILSIAHPNFTFQKNGGIDFLEREIEYYMSIGVNAVEINSNANKEWVDYIFELKKRFGIIITAGSDCHMLSKKDSKHGGLGVLNEHLDQNNLETILFEFKKKLAI